MQRIEPFNSKPARRFSRKNTHHDDAKKIGAHYSGDGNGWDHGGYFYRIQNNPADYIPFVEIGDPMSWGGDDIDPRDRFVDCGHLGTHGKTWQEVIDLNRARLSDVYSVDAAEVTIFHIVDSLLCGEFVDGAYKENDGASLVRLLARSSRCFDRTEYKSTAKPWTEHQLMNAIAGWLL